MMVLGMQHETDPGLGQVEHKAGLFKHRDQKGAIFYIFA